MKIVFATNNLNKLSEIRSLVPEGIEILSLKEINCLEELPETNPTIEENALGWKPIEDSSINALGGEPGVYSARYAGEECNAEDNISKVLKKLEGEKNKKAKFRTIIALIISGEHNMFEGECKGEITNKSGEKGFGYDPIFKPLGHQITFAEMTQDKKGKISHRGKAVAKLIDFLTR